MGPAADPQTPTRTRRRLPRWAQRTLLALVGAALMAASVTGFWWTAAAFDERRPVVVATRDLSAGHVLSASDLAPADVLLGDVPHIAWTADAPQALAGLAVASFVPAGSLIGAHLLTEPSLGAFGDALEVVVQIDASLSPSGVREGDTVLLIDPGIAPSPEGMGRPRSVIRTLQLGPTDGSSIRLFVPPAEWVWWRALPTELGAPPMLLPVPLGGKADELAAALDRLWSEAHAADIAALSPFGDEWRSQAVPGRLEVVVPLDLSLAPSGIAEGDLVLLVDPGTPRNTAGGGRPRSVLRAARLDNYRDGLLGVWAEPDDWVWWRSLPSRLGAAPMVLRVPDGTDVSAMAADLNEQWLAAWEQG